MPRVADRAGKPCPDMFVMPREACVGHDAVQVMAFGAESKWRVSGVRTHVRIEVDDGSAWASSRPCAGSDLTDEVRPFQNVVVVRSVGSAGTRAAKLAVVVAVVAIGAENARSHGTHLNPAGDIPHGGKEARLRNAGSVSHNRMARDCGSAELLDQVEGIASEDDRKSTRLNSSHRCISYAVFC